MSRIGQSGIHSRPKDLQSVKQIYQFQEFSHETSKRRCTDILCIIVGVLFSLIVIIISFAIYNHEHYIKANFPTDSEGKLCGIQYPGYNYVYFAQQTQIIERLCVQKCPQMTDTKLKCKPTKNRGCNFNKLQGFKVQQYQTEPFEDRNGIFCLPKDENARSLILQKSKLTSRNIFFNSKDTYISCSIISAILALIFLIIVQFLPKIVNDYVLYLGAIILFILVICTWTYPTSYTKSKILIGIILLFFFFIVALTIYLFRDSVQANGVFLNQATKFISDFPFVLINIPIFLGITALYTYILILQLNSIWTSSDLQFQKDKSLYWEYKQGQAVFMTVLWLIQAIWGLNFIKQSFNFIVSSFTVLWYNGYLRQGNQNKKNDLSIYLFPYKIYIMNHFGSVIACSFMSSFFNIFDTIFDLARGNKINRDNTICQQIDSFFDLVRPQAMAYITISGNAYCQAARYCEYLCQKSDVLDTSQSASRAYRISVYSTLSGFVCILGLYIHGQISIFGIGILFAFSYFIINFFVQMHADTGDACLIVYLQNQQFASRNAQMSKVQMSSINYKRSKLKQESSLNKHTRNIVQQLQQGELYFDQKYKKKQSQIREKH